MRGTYSTVISTLLVIGAAACGGGSSGPTAPKPSPTTVTVNATPALAFSPGTVTVAPGGTVTFAFGSVAHTVIFDGTTGAPADISGSNNANVSIGRTFATAGTFPYHCIIHPGMTGTVIVAATSSGTNTGAGGTGNGPGY